MKLIKEQLDHSNGSLSERQKEFVRGMNSLRRSAIRSALTHRNALRGAGDVCDTARQIHTDNVITARAQSKSLRETMVRSINEAIKNRHDKQWLATLAD